MAAVTTEFDPGETDDKSVNVDGVLGVMKHSTTDGLVLDEFSLIVVPTNDPYLADLCWKYTPSALGLLDQLVPKELLAV